MALITVNAFSAEDGAVTSQYTYNDTDSPVRLLSASATNNGSRVLRIKVARESDGATFRVDVAPGESNSITFNNSPGQRIPIDISNPAKPKFIGVSIEFQYPPHS